MQATRNVAIFGAALDTGNLGVSALGMSSLVALHRRGAFVTNFDNGRGLRKCSVSVGDETIDFSARGVWLSRRFHRSESLYNMSTMSALGLSVTNPNLMAIRRSDAVFDISGGDSFTDLYGPKRFQMVVLPKLLALRQGRPLILMPQTYGPFRSAKARRTASELVRASAQAWARDAESLERLTELAGNDCDRRHHREGVDVAFALPKARPDKLPADLDAWLADDEPVVGVNVSGLLFNDAAAARGRFGLSVDYPAAIHELLDRLAQAEQRVVLVPHVLGTSGESDSVACRVLACHRDRPQLVVAPDGLDAVTTKWLIGEMSWFTGARMHATIAALSSGVPVMATAYSDKFQGVFESCGVPDEVVDARLHSTGDLVDAWWESFTNRDQTRQLLTHTMPRVRERAEAQFDDMLHPVSTPRSAR